MAQECVQRESRDAREDEAEAGDLDDDSALRFLLFHLHFMPTFRRKKERQKRERQQRRHVFLLHTTSGHAATGQQPSPTQPLDPRPPLRSETLTSVDSDKALYAKSIQTNSRSCKKRVSQNFPRQKVCWK